MRTKELPGLDVTPDPRTEHFLLPEKWIQRDNSRRMRHCRIALRQALSRLTPEQRELVCLHHAEGLSKSAIARNRHYTNSAVSKIIRAGEAVLRCHVELYMEIYDTLEREFLDDEDGLG